MEMKQFLVNALIILFLLCNVVLSSSHVIDYRFFDEKNETIPDEEKICVYTVYVRTSKTWKAGTDSKISLVLYDDDDFDGKDGVLISDLEAWGGAMDEGHDYFERGNLDVFTGRGKCLDEDVCAIKIRSDGTGDGHGWYCNYVEVTSSADHYKNTRHLRNHDKCHQELFTVEQWIALDRSPYELVAVRNNC